MWPRFDPSKTFTPDRPPFLRYSRPRFKGERRVRCFALLLLSHPVGGTAATKRQRTCPSSCVKTDAPLLPRYYIAATGRERDANRTSLQGKQQTDVGTSELYRIY